MYKLGDTCNTLDSPYKMQVSKEEGKEDEFHYTL